MNVWHNNFDSIYNRPPKPIGEAVIQYIDDSTDNAPGSRIIEDLQAELRATKAVLAAICSALGPVEEGRIAAALRLKPGSQGDAN